MKTPKIPSSSGGPKLPHSPPAPKLPRESARPHLFRPTPLKPPAQPKQPAAAMASAVVKTKPAQWSETPTNDWSTPGDAWMQKK